MNSPECVVIFGATADSGYRLADRLVKSGHAVIGVDWVGSHSKPLVKLGARFIGVDVTNPAEVDVAFADLPPSNTAAVAYLGGSPTVNSQGNINVINSALSAGISRFVLVTSIGCGDSRGAIDPFTEAFIGKALRAKTWAEKHLRSSGLDWTIVRPGGPMVRRPTGKGALFDTPNVTGHINRIDLGDVLFNLVRSRGNVGKTLAAIDSDKAMSTTADPVTPAVI
jgi:nucleoside-diphosphate-sugar epimerase